jgi:hypothetical protein
MITVGLGLVPSRVTNREGFARCELGSCNFIQLSEILGKI